MTMSKEEATRVLFENVMKITASLDASQKEAKAIKARKDAIHELINVMSQPHMRIMMKMLMGVCDEGKLPELIGKLDGHLLDSLQASIFLAASLSLAIAYENPDMVPAEVKP